ncbi:unnamed protein product, partial [Lota lota]
MDSADSEAVRSALRTQAQRLQQQEEQLHILWNELVAMANRQGNQIRTVLHGLNAAFQASQAPVPSPDVPLILSAPPQQAVS